MKRDGKRKQHTQKHRKEKQHGVYGEIVSNFFNGRCISYLLLHNKLSQIPVA